MSFLRKITPAALTAAAALAAACAALGTAMPADAAASSNIFNTNSGRCLGIAASGDAGIWNCTNRGGTSDQSWHWGQFVTGPYGIEYGQLINGKGQCLGLRAGSTTSGNRAVGWRCLGPDHRDQYWYLDGVWAGQAGDGTVLVNLKTPCNGLSQGGKVLGVAGGSRGNGAAVVLWPSSLGPPAGHFQPNQDWYHTAP